MPDRRHTLPEAPARPARAERRRLATSPAAAALLVPLAPFALWLTTLAASAAVPHPAPHAPHAPPGALAAPSSADEDSAQRLLGLWEKSGADVPEDQVRFYYFHEGGIGLYRYGRAGLTFTQSYDWRVREGRLHLRFRKTGAAHALAYVLEEGGRLLALPQDPREASASRYRRAEGAGPAVQALAPWLDAFVAAPTPATAESCGPACAAGLGTGPGGQMWIDYQPYATGGAGFAIYQFAEAALDGRGVGWHHRGDFDDWSTEAFHYQAQGKTLRLRFDRFGDAWETPFQIAAEPAPLPDNRAPSAAPPPATRAVLELAEDPRNGWHRSRLLHLGRSFAF